MPGLLFCELPEKPRILKNSNVLQNRIIIPDNYWKKSRFAFDKGGVTQARLEILEVVQDEMVAAPKSRETR
ncbi:hypothetical protein ANCCEY_00077 [Ancylostoma ceylanicum]|uniref:Uncharacterized protein n=1 Tax=Ancylostoma ceylanicum TaxID=53326 RepID=A0A0D6M9U4_9BILA|nr:hypothetical protein ANCCEY_00077 [Ancylostoma ceylanicum]